MSDDANLPAVPPTPDVLTDELIRKIAMDVGKELVEGSIAAGDTRPKLPHSCGKRFTRVSPICIRARSSTDRAKTF